MLRRALEYLSMKEYLKDLPWFLAAVVVLVAIGFLIERWRRRDLERWAAAQGGTFEGGGILDEIAVPEAVPFDTHWGKDKVTYNSVTRIQRPEATYTLTQFYHHYLDTKNTPKSSSCVVCFVTLPDGEWPSVGVYRPVLDLFGRPKPAPLAVPDALPAFTAAFEANLVGDVPAPSPEAMARFLPPAVQNELLANETLIAGIRGQGRAIRIQAVGQVTGYPHAKVFEVAQRMVAAWTAKR